VLGYLPDQETHSAEYGPVISSGIFQFYDDDEPPIGGINMMLLNNAEPPMAQTAIEREEIGDDLLAEIDRTYGGTIGTTISVEMLPREDNTISLDDSTTDDHGNPVLDVDISPDQYVRDAAAKGAQVMTDIVEELGGSIVFEQGSHTPDAEFIEQAQGGYHPMGGTRMGTDPSESVVDPTLKTHDLDNLYISGGGVFVTGGASNPTLTIMALSLKAADHIHERL